jgi:hypothetical protein
MGEFDDRTCTALIIGCTLHLHVKRVLQVRPRIIHSGGIAFIIGSLTETSQVGIVQ